MNTEYQMAGKTINIFKIWSFQRRKFDVDEGVQHQQKHFMPNT